MEWSQRYVNNIDLHASSNEWPAAINDAVQLATPCYVVRLAPLCYVVLS